MRGQLQDLILIPVILLVFMFVLFPLLNVVNTFRADATLSTEQKQILDYQTYAIRGFDSMTVFIFVCMILLIGGLAYLVRSSPIGIAIVLFLGLAVLLLGAMFSNIFHSVATDTNFVASAEQFPLAINLFDKMPIFVAIGIFVVALFLFGKPFGGG
jgi:hypothetical protein